MLSIQKQKEFYQALLDKNIDYEGIFHVGVKSTGIFCRPSCSARKPKFENCEFFTTAQEALLSSYRPCRRCLPLSPLYSPSPTIQALIEAVEKNPTKRWTERDFKELSIDASTARRQFKKRFGMTFVGYARARRMGLAMKHIRKGDEIIEAQLTAGYESSSGFRDAFSRIMGAAPTLLKNRSVLKAAWIETPLVPMIAIADEKGLYLLEFISRRALEREIQLLREKTKLPIIPGTNVHLQSIEAELGVYFERKGCDFKTPLCLVGTPFQKQVWAELQNIPVGQTRSYAELAKAIGQPTACRAVAGANGRNQLALIIPCHRVINSNGELGGYGGGVARKEWLLEHERQYL